VPIEVHDVRVLRPGERIIVGGGNGAAPGQVILAFDGEREIALIPGSVADVQLLADGPRVLDAAGLLRAAAADGLLVAPEVPDRWGAER
jgi:hypothetical protein